jgi:hypothetical protein
MKKCASLIALACAIASPAFAEPGGVSSVSGPTVHDGDTKVELRTAAYDGGALDGAWAHRAQIGHSFTDWYQATLIARASQADGDDPEVRSIGIENRVDFAGTRAWPVHFGAQVEYKFGLNGADDEVELKLLAEHTSGPLTARFNLITERATSDGADWENGYAARFMWRTSETISLGLEAYGEIDTDAHAVGPRATFRVGEGATLGLGYLVGLDEAGADGQFRLGVEWSP